MTPALRGALAAATAGALLAQARPAAATGLLLSPAGGLADDSAPAAPAIAQARALLIEDGDGAVMVLQGQLEDGAAEGAWLVPLPGGPVGSSVAFVDDGLETLLSLTDPLFRFSAGGSGCLAGSGCSQVVRASGDPAEVREFGDTTRRGQTSVFPAGAADALLSELAWEGYALPDAAAAQVRDLAAQGWGFAVVRLRTRDDGGFSPVDATPLVALRTAEPVLTMPMALTRHSSAAELHAIVLTVADERRDPTVLGATEVRLGDPLYAPREAPVFYQARLRVALDEAPGPAWVLEYANTLDAVTRRAEEIGALDDPLLLLDRLAARGVLQAPQASTRWISRWRTYLPPDQLQDEVFTPSARGAYAIELGPEGWVAGAWLLVLPLGAWGLGRRRQG